MGVVSACVASWPLTERCDTAGLALQGQPRAQRSWDPPVSGRAEPRSSAGWEVQSPAS